MRFAINLTCCLIMVSATMFDLWMGDFKDAGFCALVALFTGLTALADSWIRGIKS